MKLGFASDHRGFELKEKLIKYYNENYEIVDCGTNSNDSCDYPVYAYKLGKLIVRSIFDRTLFVLGRAISVAAPVGIVIWLFANITIGDSSILFYIASFLDVVVLPEEDGPDINIALIFLFLFKN